MRAFYIFFHIFIQLNVARNSELKLAKTLLLKSISEKFSSLDIDNVSIDNLNAILALFSSEKPKLNKTLPIVVNTWPFVAATFKAWQILEKTDDSLEAVIEGCSECEDLRCDGTVGWGGSPDEHAESTLDALIIDGKTHDAGSVASLKGIKSAIKVANAVRLYSSHTLIVGEQATQFGIDMGFKQEDLHSLESVQKWLNWFNNSCQPNFRRNVIPNPEHSCGPYKPDFENKPKLYENRYSKHISTTNHDTIGMIAIDSKGNVAGGTSTNGASFKIPGRVGDSPIIGSGAYVDNDVGGACGTGDGDILMRFLPAYQAVESMRNGMNPTEATQDAILRILKYYSNFVGAILAVDKYGNHGAACHGLDKFPYSYKDSQSDVVKILYVPCI